MSKATTFLEGSDSNSVSVLNSLITDELMLKSAKSEMTMWSQEEFKYETAMVADPEFDATGLDNARKILASLSETYKIPKFGVSLEYKLSWILQMMTDLASDYARIKVRGTGYTSIGDTKQADKCVEMLEAIHRKVDRLIEYRDSL